MSTAMTGPDAQPSARPQSGPPRISLAPMRDRTDRHLRYLIRLLSRRTWLYTEMVTTGAVLRGDRAQLLDFWPEEHPVALQLGGDDPAALAACAALAAEWGYDEINLNCGCPSDRVQQGAFGAALMRTPARAAEAVRAMVDATDRPVTVKHRIGVDDLDHYDDMRRFVDAIAAAGCRRVIVHARKAWLSGLSPHENRTVPPLRYPEVWRLAAERPDLAVEINGGIRSAAEARPHLQQVNGVMIGRAAYEDTYAFAAIDAEIFHDPAPPPSRSAVALAMDAYLARPHGRGFKPHHALRHLLELYAGCPGARRWRRVLTEGMGRGEGAGLVERALDVLGDAA